MLDPTNKLRKGLLTVTTALVLASCGGSESEPEQQTEQQTETESQQTQRQLNAQSLSTTNFVPQPKLAGSPITNKQVVSQSILNAEVVINYPKAGTQFTGNISTVVNVTDPDGISRVLLRFGESESAYVLCDSECSTDFSALVTGISPQLFGAVAGELNLSLWVEDAIGSPIEGDTVNINWTPRTISGVSAQIDEETNTLNIQWNQNAEFLRYNVYIANDPNLTAENVGEVTGGEVQRSISGSSASFSDKSIDDDFYIIVSGIDGSGESAFSGRIIMIAGNETVPPNAVSDQFSTAEDMVLNGNVLDNDESNSNENLQANPSLLAEPENGTVTLNNDGNFSYQPNTNFNGNDQFTYQIANESGLTSDATVFITVTPVNDAPESTELLFIFDGDSLTQAAPGLLANAVDIDGDALSVVLNPVTLPKFGSLQMFADGEFNYTPSDDFVNYDNFQFQISDGTDVITVEATVATEDFNGSYPAIAVGDSYTVNEDAMLSVPAETGILANDFDEDGDINDVTLAVISAPSSGSLILASDGSFTYSPSNDFFGNVTFEYSITDADANTTSAFVAITVASVNDAPVANDDFYSVANDGVTNIYRGIGVLANDSDIDGDNIEVSVETIGQPTSGTLSMSAAGNFQYTPTENFIGTDSFTYRVSDGSTLSNVATVTLSVFDVFADANDNAELVIPLTDVSAQLANNATLTNVTSTLGSISFDQTQITYTPTYNSSGFDTLMLEFESAGESFVISLRIRIVQTNQAPVLSVVESLNIDENSAAGTELATFTATDPEQHGLTFSMSQSGDLFALDSDTGVLTVAESATLDFETASSHSVNVTVTDEYGLSDEITVVISINNVNEAPSFSSSSAVTIDENPELGDLVYTASATDTDASDTLSYAFATAVQGLSIDASSGQITVSDVSVFDHETNDAVSLTLTVTDAGGLTDSLDLTVSVNDVNEAPVIQSATLVIDEVAENYSDSVAASLYVIAVEDSDDGEQLSWTLDADANFNIDNATGNIEIIANASFDYEATSSYTLIATVTDSGGLTDQIELTLPITNVNEAPTANVDYATVTNYSSINIDVLINDTDPEGDNLTVISASATDGTVTIESDGSLSYVPNYDISSDTISYTIEDAGSLTSVGSVEMTIDPLALAGNHDLNDDGTNDITATFDSSNNAWGITIDSSVSNAFVVSNDRYYPLEKQQDGSFETTLDANIDNHEIRLIIGSKVHVFSALNLTTDAAAGLDLSGNELTTNISEISLPASFMDATATWNGQYTNENATFYPWYRRGATFNFNVDGTGLYFNQSGKDSFTWTSTGNQIVAVEDSPETSTEELTIEEILELGLITQTEHDDYKNLDDYDGSKLTVTSVQNSITLTFSSNQVYYYDVAETIDKTYTLPDAFSNRQENTTESGDEYRLYDLARISQHDNSSFAAGSYFVPYFTYVDGVPDETVTEAATFNSDGTGSYDDLGIGFTWSINSDGDLTLSTDDYFDYTFSVIQDADNAYAKQIYASATNNSDGEQLSAFYYLVQNTAPSSADVTAVVSDKLWNSSFTLLDVDAYTDGLLNGNNIFAFDFSSSQAENARDGENAAARVYGYGTGFQLSNWTWTITDSTVELIRYYDSTQGVMTCNPDTNSNCYAMQIRTLKVAYIDSENGRIWLTENQDFIDFSSVGVEDSPTYTRVIENRLNYYEITDIVTTSADATSIDEDNSLTGFNVVSNDVDSLGGSDLYLVGVQASQGTGSIDDNSSLSYVPNADVNGDIEIFYAVIDSQNAIGYDIATVTINPVNDAPIAADDDLSTSEGDIISAYDLLANDSDTDGDNLTITAIGSATNGSVTDNGDGTIDYTHDGSETLSDSFTYTISDGDLTATATVNLTISAVNDAPEITTSTSSFNINEGQILNIDFDATDAESNNITYSISAYASSEFSIDSNTGELTFNAQNYEAPLDSDGNNSYSVTVTATDDGSPSETDTFNVVVNVQNVNEAPTLTNSSSSINVDENQTSVVTATASDVDSSDTQTFSLSGTDASLFSIGSSTGTVTFNSAPDFETPTDSGADGTYNFDLVVTDGGGLTDTLSFAVTVDNLNEAASFSSSATPSVAENQTAIMTVTASDPENDSLTFSKNGGADSEYFNITSAGVLTFSTAPDYEGFDDADSDNVYEVVVDVVDSTGSNTTVSQTVKVTITDANESPVISGSNTVAIDENTANGTSVYTATVADPESDAITWSLTDSSGIFAINSSTGEVTINDNSNLDYESLTTTTITLSADDLASTPDSLAVTVTVNDVVENVELQGDASFGYSAQSSFNTYTAVNNNNETVVELVQQSDKQLLHVVNYVNASSVGKIYVVRTSTDGKNDITYGTNGRSYISFSDSITATRAIVDSSDNLYIIGYETVAGVDTAMILKLDSSGSLDTSFDSDGKALINLVSSGNSRASDLLIHSNGTLYMSATGTTVSEASTLKIASFDPNTGATTELYDGDPMSAGVDVNNIALVENSNNDSSGDKNLVAIGDYAQASHQQIYLAEFELDNMAAGPIATTPLDYSNSIAGNGGEDYLYSYVVSNTATDRVYIAGQTNENVSNRLRSFIAYINLSSLAVDTNFGTAGYKFFDADPSATDANYVSGIAQDSSGNIVAISPVSVSYYVYYYLTKFSELGDESQAGDVADFNSSSASIYSNSITNYNANLVIDVSDANDTVYTNFEIGYDLDSELGIDLGFRSYSKDGTEDLTSKRFASFGAVDESFTNAIQLTQGSNGGEFVFATSKNDGDGPSASYSYLSNSGFVDKTYRYRGHSHISSGGGESTITQIGVVETSDGKFVQAYQKVSDLVLDKVDTSGTEDATFPSKFSLTVNMTPTGIVYDQVNDHIVVFGYDAADIVVVRASATDGTLYNSDKFSGGIATFDLGGTDKVTDALVQTDGSLVLFGNTDLVVNSDTTQKLYMLHVSLDGTVQTDLDANDADPTGGVYTFSLSSASDFDAIDAIQTSDNKIYVVGNLSGGATLDVAKFDFSTKTLDSGFGSSGVSTITLGVDVNASGLVLSSSDELYLFGQTDDGDDYDGLVAQIDTTNGGLYSAFNGFGNEFGGQGYFLYDNGGNETIDGAIYTSSGQLLIIDSQTGAEGKTDIRLTLYDIVVDDSPPAM